MSPDVNIAYGAITIDTSIFDSYGLRLKRNPLALLDQFKGKPVGLVLSDVVAQEVLSHLRKRNAEVADSIHKATKDASDFGFDDKAIAGIRLSLEDRSADESANVQWREFIESNGGGILDSSQFVPIADLVAKYFAAEAPFSENGSKKNEFPDAIALLAIEGYAKSIGRKVIAVSKDGDWRRFAESSEWVDFEDDLPDALSHFQPQAAAYDFCGAFASDWAAGKFAGVVRDIEAGIEQELEVPDINVEATAYLHWEVSDHRVELLGLSPRSGSESFDVSLMKIDQEGWDFAVKLSIECNVHVEFLLSAYDHFDGDYVGVGRYSGSENVDVDAEVYVTMQGDLSGGDGSFEVVNVEVRVDEIYVDFGEIEPDFADE